MKYYGLLFIFFTEQILRKNKTWNLIINHFKNGSDIFLNWRSQTYILEEFRIISTLFSKIGALSFVLIILMPILKIYN